MDRYIQLNMAGRIYLSIPHDTQTFNITFNKGRVNLFQFVARHVDIFKLFTKMDFSERPDIWM